MKALFSRVKPYLRWVILGGTLFFLAQALKENWQEVAEIGIEGIGWREVAIAFGITLLAHVWSGWVWLWILREFNRAPNRRWGMQVYLKTNIAKYLPGNVWHFYGRIWAIRDTGIPLEIAALSVLLEPLLMAAAALAIAVAGSASDYAILQAIALVAVLGAVHPRVLNPVTRYLGKLKLKASKSSQSPEIAPLSRYPVRPFLGEIGFVGLRGIGFLWTMRAIAPVEWSQLPAILGAFGIAWLLGLVVPGAPGGIGVFEATAIALLEGRLAPAVLLSAVVIYRFVSVVAEAAAAAIAWWDEQLSPKYK